MQLANAFGQSGIVDQDLAQLAAQQSKPAKKDYVAISAEMFAAEVATLKTEGYEAFINMARLALIQDASLVSEILEKNKKYRNTSVKKRFAWICFRIKDSLTHEHTEHARDLAFHLITPDVVFSQEQIDLTKI